MPSAWGDSWGDAWGDSWQAGVEAPPVVVAPSPAISGGFAIGGALQGYSELFKKPQKLTPASVREVKGRGSVRGFNVRVRVAFSKTVQVRGSVSDWKCGRRRTHVETRTGKSFVAGVRGDCRYSGVRGMSGSERVPVYVLTGTQSRTGSVERRDLSRVRKFARQKIMEEAMLLGLVE